MARSTSSSVRQSVGRGTGCSHSARKELAAVQTRGSSRAGQLQCGLRRRGAGSSRLAGRRRQAQAGGVPRIARGLEGKKINLVIVLLVLQEKGRSCEQCDRTLVTTRVSSTPRHIRTACIAHRMSSPLDSFKIIPISVTTNCAPPPLLAETSSSSWRRTAPPLRLCTMSWSPSARA